MLLEKLQIGRIAIGLEGEGAVFGALRSELLENLEVTEVPTSIEFRIFPELPDRTYRQNGCIRISGNILSVDMMGMRYEMTSLSNPTSIAVAFDPRRSLISQTAPRVAQLRNWNYLSQSEELAKNFMYDLFDWSTQLAQLRQGQSYIHASSVQRGDRGLAILGWGGVGKTTSLLKLVIEHGWKFLSDDLGVIDSTGMLYRAPKRLQIYGYNCSGQSHITNRLMAGRSFEDRLNWRARLLFFGGKAVRRRISASDLFGPDALGDAAQLTDIIYLERTSSSDYSMSEMSTAEAARRMAAIVMAEIEPFSRIVREAEAAGFPDIPDVAEAQQKARDIFERAFSDKRCTLIQTNETIDPDQLVIRIKEITD